MDIFRVFILPAIIFSVLAIGITFVSHIIKKSKNKSTQDTQQTSQKECTI